MTRLAIIFSLLFVTPSEAKNEQMICEVICNSADWGELKVYGAEPCRPLIIWYKNETVDIQRKGFEKYTLSKVLRNSETEEFFADQSRPELLVWPLGKQRKYQSPRLFMLWDRTSVETLDCNLVD